MAAFSPDYAWSVWVGYNSEEQKKGYYPQYNRDADRIASIIAQTVHDGGLKNNYPAQPSGVKYASCVAGVYPYKVPGKGFPEDRIEKGYFKTNNMPSGTISTDNSTIDALKSFTAQLNDNNQIYVEFTPYPNKEPSDSEDLTHITGTVLYAVDIQDGNGKIVHSEKLSSHNGVLQYTLPTAGTYYVIGYYTYETGTTTSNKITQTITLDGEENNDPIVSYRPNEISSTTASFQLYILSGYSVQATLKDNQTNEVIKEETLNESGVLSYSQLQPNTSYRIEIIAKRSNENLTLDSIQFSTINE